MRRKIIALMFITQAAAVIIFAQGARDSLFSNSNNAGIPNSGNTLQPNNGPESPHTSFPIQSTDPGPLFHGPSDVMFDSIPDPQKYARPQ